MPNGCGESGSGPTNRSQGWCVHTSRNAVWFRRPHHVINMSTHAVICRRSTFFILFPPFAILFILLYLCIFAAVQRHLVWHARRPLHRLRCSPACKQDSWENLTIVFQKQQNTNHQEISLQCVAFASCFDFMILWTVYLPPPISKWNCPPATANGKKW